MESNNFLDNLKEMYEHDLEELQTMNFNCPKKTQEINRQINKYRLYIQTITNIKTNGRKDPYSSDHSEMSKARKRFRSDDYS